MGALLMVLLLVKLKDDDFPLPEPVAVVVVEEKEEVAPKENRGNAGFVPVVVAPNENEKGLKVFLVAVFFFLGPFPFLPAFLPVEAPPDVANEKNAGVAV